MASSKLLTSGDYPHPPHARNILPISWPLDLIENRATTASLSTLQYSDARQFSPSIAYLDSSTYLPLNLFEKESTSEWEQGHSEHDPYICNCAPVTFLCDTPLCSLEHLYSSASPGSTPSRSVPVSASSSSSTQQIGANLPGTTPLSKSEELGACDINPSDSRLSNSTNSDRLTGTPIKSSTNLDGNLTMEVADQLIDAYNNNQDFDEIFRNLNQTSSSSSSPRRPSFGSFSEELINTFASFETDSYESPGQKDGCDRTTSAKASPGTELYSFPQSLSSSRVADCDGAPVVIHPHDPAGVMTKSRRQNYVSPQIGDKYKSRSQYHPPATIVRAVKSRSSSFDKRKSTRKQRETSVMRESIRRMTALSAKPEQGASYSPTKAGTNIDISILCRARPRSPDDNEVLTNAASIQKLLGCE